MSHLQIISALEELAERQAQIIRALSARLAQLGAADTGRDEIEAAYAAGKIMAGVNSSHGIGTSVGAETHAITVSELPSHAHNYNGWAIEIPDGGASGNYALAKPYDQHNNFGMNTKSAGGGAAMSLMQPTTYVYIWQRIS